MSDTNVTDIVAVLLSQNISLPLNVSFGLLGDSHSREIQIAHKDMSDVTPQDLEEHGVLVTVKIDSNRNMRYLLRGEHDALDAFMKENFRLGNYHGYLNALNNFSF